MAKKPRAAEPAGNEVPETGPTAPGRGTRPRPTRLRSARSDSQMQLFEAEVQATVAMTSDLNRIVVDSPFVVAEGSAGGERATSRGAKSVARGRTRRRKGDAGGDPASTTATSTASVPASTEDDLDAAFATMADGIFRSAAKDLAGSSALEAEMWVAGLLGVWRSLRLVDDADPVEVIDKPLIERAVEVAAPISRVVCDALAVVAPDEDVRLHAKDGAMRLERGRVRVPRWARGVGQARFVKAMMMDHELRDGHTIFLAFAYPGGDQHTVNLYIDRNMGGLAKDFFVGPSVAQIAATVMREREPGMSFEQIDPAEARARYEEALRILDLTPGADVRPEVAEYRVFGEARLALLPPGGTVPVAAEVAAAERDVLIAEFVGSVEAAAAVREFGVEIVGAVTRLFVDFAVGYAGGDPLRVSPTTVEVFMVSWYPRQVVHGEELASAVPHVFLAWAAWCHDRQQLAGSYLEDIAAAVARWTAELDRAVRNPSALRIGQHLVSGRPGDSGETPRPKGSEGSGSERSAQGTRPDGTQQGGGPSVPELTGGLRDDDLDDARVADAVHGRLSPEDLADWRARAAQGVHRIAAPSPVQLAPPLPRGEVGEILRGLNRRGVAPVDSDQVDAVAKEAARVCRAVLDAEYQDLAFKMISALARQRPNPLLRGRADIWAGAVLCLLGQMNYLWDDSMAPYVPARDFAVFVGAAPHSLTQKATAIRQMLVVKDRDPRFLREQFRPRR